MPAVIDTNICIGCGTCEECPGDVIFLMELDGRKVAVVKYPEECWFCGSCRQDCPVDAISIDFGAINLLL